VDPHDSVGILDRYFNDASFFTEFERFDRHLENLKRNVPGEKIDYLSICSPNNLHDAHIRLALRLGANAICEKPLVINPWNLDVLQELEEESASKVYTVLQLRLLPSLIKLKKESSAKKNSKKHDVELTYITPRGMWYSYSWKGNPERSGGIGTNIGIHFFDLLLWLFGGTQKCEVHISNSSRTGGFIELENANIKWFLSLNKNDIPPHAKESNSTFRSIKVDNKEIEFSKGFTNLHTRVYENILDGNGYGIEDARASIELAYKIRNAAHCNNFDYLHPIVKKLLKK
ncbi:MAG: Gfo/Idh/MocA family oxidoreductase, partial [Ignavibacteria bacterium]|nr:Gfo/Idh/MocA family oxidoreductase [Ignavibacteria bacterium]